MRYRLRILGAVVAFAALFATSCTTEEKKTDYEAIEQQILDDWMAIHRPALLENRQEEGYFVDLKSEGDVATRPIGDTICWVKYDLTTTDLWGNVCLTRNDLVAWQQGAFTNKTHYVPFYRLSTKSDYSVLEGTQLAFSNKLTIGNKEVQLYNGAEFELYMPSSVVNNSDTSGSGGYEGQYSLDSSKPMVARVRVTDVIYDPLVAEVDEMDAFAIANGGLTITEESLDKEESKASEEEDPNAWTNAVDTLPDLYINRRYTPATSGASFTYSAPYVCNVPDSPYSKGGVAAVDDLINAALAERFTDIELDGEEVDKDNDAKVWYIGRFLDGFIFDTNIDEVKEIIYGKAEEEGSAITFNAEEDKDSYILSWYYSIPKMQYGRWSAILTSSSFAYGSKGVVGQTTSTTTGGSSSGYNDYYNMYNYYNGMYGNSYYNNMYGSNYYYDPYSYGYGGGYGYGYGSYDPYGYGSGYGYGGTTNESVTTVTTSTEIPAYTPLIFEIYIEPAEEDKKE